MPLIALFSGARLNEICQLRTEDVRTADGILCINIDETDGTMKVKSEAGRRAVPVHHELIRLGFADYQARMAKSGSTRLFPGLERGAGGYYSDNFTKWYGRWLKRTLSESVVERDGLTFHSFRHGFKDAMRDAGLEEAIQNRIIGHEDRHIGSQYGAGYRLEKLKGAIDRVEFRGLNLDHLAHSDSDQENCPQLA